MVSCGKSVNLPSEASRVIYWSKGISSPKVQRAVWIAFLFQYNSIQVNTYSFCIPGVLRMNDTRHGRGVLISNVFIKSRAHIGIKRRLNVEWVVTSGLVHLSVRSQVNPAMFDSGIPGLGSGTTEPQSRSASFLAYCATQTLEGAWSYNLLPCCWMNLRRYDQISLWWYPKVRYFVHQGRHCKRNPIAVSRTGGAGPTGSSKFCTLTHCQD